MRYDAQMDGKLSSYDAPSRSRLGDSHRDAQQDFPEPTPLGSNLAAGRKMSHTSTTRFCKFQPLPEHFLRGGYVEDQVWALRNYTLRGKVGPVSRKRHRRTALLRVLLESI